MAAMRDGGGYWLVASNGVVYPFGGAVSYGPKAKLHLTKPIVGIASTADGKGYWLVASNGQVFNYGDAVNYGSPAKLHLTKADRRHRRHTRREGLLAGGVRRGHIQLR